MRWQLTLSCAGLALTSVACDDPLVDPQTVAGLRLLGAKVQADEDPSRAELTSGESGQLSWLVVSDEVESYQAHLALCRAEPTTLGVPLCDGDPFEQLSSEAVTTAAISFDLELPSELKAGEQWVAFFGACHGDARFDNAAGGFDCDDGKHAINGFYRSTLIKSTDVDDAQANKNPELSDDIIQLGSQLWEPPAEPLAPGEECTGGSLPTVTRDTATPIDVKLITDDRQTLPSTGEYGAHTRESLVFTTVATQPGLDRAFSAVDYNQKKTGFSVEFRAPQDLKLPRAGKRVAFYLLVNDERGGVDWQIREFCLEP